MRNDALSAIDWSIFEEVFETFLTSDLFDLNFIFYFFIWFVDKNGGIPERKHVWMPAAVRT